MKVLMLAFMGDGHKNGYMPEYYGENCVVYTGTHDHNTIRGWFQHEAKKNQKDYLYRYLGHKVSEEEVHWKFIRLAMKSRGNTVIIPMQDVLGLGQETRMNKPSTQNGTWRWTLLDKDLNPSVARKVSNMTGQFGRN